MECPVCGANASGKFCSQCGASLAVDRFCSECGNPIPPGGRFCNMCGTPAPAAGVAPAGATPKTGGGKSGLPILLGAGAVLLIAAAVLIPRLRSDESTPFAPAAPAAAPAGDPSAVDLGSMTPEEAAGRLFERVMRSASSGDSAQARAFAPMAIASYDRVGDRTLDVHFHLSQLYLVQGDFDAARAHADTILSEVPTHLLGLATAADVEAWAGNVGEARELYQRFLTNFDSELETQRTEYAEHRDGLPIMREVATRYLQGSN